VYFRHSTEIWNDFSELVSLAAENISADVAVQDAFVAAATSRLETHSEGDLPETQAWRRAFSRVGSSPPIIAAPRRRKFCPTRDAARERGAKPGIATDVGMQDASVRVGRGSVWGRGQAGADRARL
jgi:hypothetical protein